MPPSKQDRIIAPKPSGGISASGSGERKAISDPSKRNANPPDVQKAIPHKMPDTNPWEAGCVFALILACAGKREVLLVD